ncbi:hypothetical protein GPECTOR_843g81 [Gonium pectorale]|uniref:Uncharacterized protein n=1 Tax=Gonium pectorale TaxID=33097 RepID=A0A150FTY9_GONPE|nr:hypothetical protein GPECTOR_843g81 [Gonium pectorale]|eukprot:KXZ41074.1 hypothetical protein GPECTOR_843g81 [Gonium pectorale]
MPIRSRWAAGSEMVGRRAWTERRPKGRPVSQEVVQNVMLAPSLVAVATFFINIGAHAVLVSALGFSGAPLATTLSRWAQFLLMAGCFDFATALAGRLGPVNTAAHAATLSVVTLTYLACPFALATAGAIRVGNLLGSGQPDAAQRAGILAVVLPGTFMAVMVIILLSCHHVLGYMFNTDPRVVRVISHLALFAALSDARV